MLMKRRIILICALFYSLYGYCQERELNAYSRIIPKKYANKSGTIEASKDGNLVLYLDNTPYVFYAEEWTPNEGEVILYVNGKKKTFKRSELEDKDYLLIHGKDGNYDITVRGGNFIRLSAKGTYRANELFKQLSHPAHYAHASHYSSYIKK